MNAESVTRLVRDQVANRDSLENSHGVDLERCLVRPILIRVINRGVGDGRLKDTVETVWLVLEENPSGKDGYKIIFDEQRKMFGLASIGFVADQYPVLCGYYGDFPTTLRNM